MITHRSTLFIVLITILAFIILITIPITVLFDNFTNYGKIEESLSFYYSPEVPSLTDELKINTDIGNIEIIYATVPTDYPVSIEVNINVAGLNIADKSYLDYFDIVWNETSTPATFNFTIKSNKWLEASNWFSRNINIFVILRAEIVFNVTASSNEGNIKTEIPFGVSIENLITKSMSGNIKLDFDRCILAGNITGTTNTGNITLNSYNVEYIRNSSWIIDNDRGNTLFDITQYDEMGANITVKGITNTGFINVTYEDYTPNVGAFVKLYNYTSIPPYSCIWEGFNYNTPLSGHEFISYDFPAINFYNITLYQIDGNYVWNLYSEPT
ncbi:MAG: hypothetical protein ACFFC9_07115 [Promethearchaeota archaeon]